MSKIIRVKGSELKKMIRTAIVESPDLTEDSLAQAKVSGPLQKFVSNMNGAKAALGELFQQVSDQKASDQAQALLNAVNRIIKALDNMPELTKDPWHGVRKRD